MPRTSNGNDSCDIACFRREKRLFNCSKMCFAGGFLVLDVISLHRLLRCVIPSPFQELPSEMQHNDQDQASFRGLCLTIYPCQGVSDEHDQP